MMATKEKKEEKVEIKPPKLYKVLLHNDNYTSMEFVILVLKNIFQKDNDEAVRIMLNVHNKGIGVCGVYPRAVAESKIERVKVSAESQGFPLLCSYEPE